MKIQNPWRKPTANDKQKEQLEAAKLALVDAKSRLDWEATMVDYYTKMIKRLESEIK